MSRPDNLTTLLCTGFILLHLFFLGLWTFALWRTRLWFFFVMIAAGVFAVGISVINLALYYDPPTIPRILGRQLYAAFFYCFIWAQRAVGVLEFVGSVLMVRWIVTSYDRQKQEQPV